MYSIPGFKQLVELLHWILVTIHDALAGQGLGPDWTWGLAIIGLTIIVRLILFPLTWKQYSTAQALQAMQPKVRELQRKYKDDRNKLQQETMKLYQEHRVNPFASCLPLLLQLPVFIALYGAISGYASYLDQGSVRALADAGFLWIRSVAGGGGGLGKPDPTYVLLVLYVVTQLISTELMLVTQTDKLQKMLMRAMPIIFVFFLWNFPSGLFVYWVTTNLWTIGQQLLIRKAMKPYAVPAAEGKPAKRSRIVDALVSAQEQGGKARAARSPGKATDARQKRGGGQGRAAPARKASEPAGAGGSAAGTKPGADGRPAGSKPAGTKEMGGSPSAKRGGRKPPPGKTARRTPAATPPATASPETTENGPAD